MCTALGLQVVQYKVRTALISRLSAWRLGIHNYPAMVFQFGEPLGHAPGATTALKRQDFAILRAQGTTNTWYDAILHPPNRRW